MPIRFADTSASSRLEPAESVDGPQLCDKAALTGGRPNVRDDKILTSKFWRPSFEQRRCLVPASLYCEPKGVKPATWHWFALNGDEHRPLFEGMWTRYRGALKKDGEHVDQERRHDQTARDAADARRGSSDLA